MNKRLRKKKGLSKITEEELWGLDITLAKYILPRLIKFKEINIMGRPTDFDSQESWHKVIDKMIYSFQYVLEQNSGVYDVGLKAKEDKYQEGMQLFARYFMDLWD